MPVAEIAADSLPKTQVLRLYIGHAFTGVPVEPDSRWPKMWRDCKDGLAV
jgi:hypothetical protein